MPPEDHRLDVVLLVDVGLVFEDAIDPARYRHAGFLHHLLVGEAAEQVVVVNIPDAGPVLPRAFLDAVVAWQCVAQDAKIRRALHVVVATEDVCATAGTTDVTQGQLQDAVGAGVVVAVGVLRATHAPDQCAWFVGRERAGNAAS